VQHGAAPVDTIIPRLLPSVNRRHSPSSCDKLV